MPNAADDPSPAPRGRAVWALPLEALRALARRRERAIYGGTFWELYAHIQCHEALVRGARNQIMPLAFQTAGRVVDRLALVAAASGAPTPHLLDAEAFCESEEERASAAELKTLFDRYGSDKATLHNYHHIYGAVLSRLAGARAVLEIGIGTNFSDAVSNMTESGSPGASLRAFRDYLPGAEIWGADVDRRVLFAEDRIRTLFIDQTDLTSFAEAEAIGPLDLLIDDGLHAPDANLAVLAFGLRQVRAGGWIVIEDIPERALPVWQVVAAMLPSAFGSSLVRTRTTYVFVVRKPA